jgi:hypothetical protein
VYVYRLDANERVVFVAFAVFEHETLVVALHLLADYANLAQVL